MRSINVIIPAQDAPLIHHIADILQKGGDEAESLRQQLRQITGVNLENTGDNPKRTGADLIEFFRNLPLAEIGLELARELERDRAASRMTDI